MITKSQQIYVLCVLKLYVHMWLLKIKISLENLIIIIIIILYILSDYFSLYFFVL
jgi:hypothetical protein